MRKREPTGDPGLDGLSLAVDDILQGNQLDIEHSQ